MVMVTVGSTLKRKNKELMMDDKLKIKEFLDLFEKRVKTSDSYASRALYKLLKEYESKLPNIDDYFHKAFRQIDVTDSGNIDMAIWLLINESDDFWYCHGVVNKDKFVDLV